MVTTEQLAPVLDLISTVADGDAALDAITTVRNMDLSPEDRRRTDETVAALIDDPRFAARRGELYRMVAHVPAAAARLATIAGDDDGADQRDALVALAEQDPGTWADRYARWLLARDPAPAGPLAALPLDRTTLTADDITPLLENEDDRLFAAIALAKVGSPGALLRVLDEIEQNPPQLLWGNPFDAYACLTEAQPLPEPAVATLLQRLPTGSHQGDLVIWALTGVADAEGTLLLDRPTPPAPPPDADPAGATEVADRLGRDGLAATMHLDFADLSPLRAAKPAAAAGLVERLVAEAATVSDPDEVMMAGNALMRVVSVLPSPIPLRIDKMVTHWQRHGSVLPDDQLGAVLCLAGEERLLVAFQGALRKGDTTLAHVLRVAHEVRGTAPMHGAGPSGPARRTLGLTRAEPPPAMATMAEPPAEMMTAARAPMRIEAAMEPPAPPGPPAPRRLRGQVTDADGTLRSHAFAPGVRHSLGLWFGPGGDGPLVAADALDESVLVRDETGTAKLLVAVIGTEGVTRVDPQQQEIDLPLTGSSKRQDFAIDVAPDATHVTLNVVVYHQRKQIQTVDVVGPVAADDAPVGTASLAFDRRTESAPMPGSDVDVSFTFHVGGAGEVLVHDGKLRQVTIADLDQFRDGVTTLLQDALSGDDADDAGGAPGSEQQVALLRSLAGVGNELWEMRLSKVLGGVRPESSIQVTTDGDDVVPLEFVYDRGVPTKNAKLCKRWQEALRDGECPTCKPGSGRKRTVCPLGFWGIRLVVERQTTSDLDEGSAPGRIGPTRTVLRDVDRVLFAASKRVDKRSTNATATTTKLLTDLLDDRFASASSWADWTKKVASHRPGMLLTLPHNEQDDGVAALQIGAKSSRRIREITSADVLPKGAEVGPVVLLLGCDTANAPVSWQTAVAKFRALGAAVVIGTLVETLGRQTAPTAQFLAGALWGEEDDRIQDPTVGEVVRALRRRLLLKGWTLGMSLVAYGDADWRLRP